jgi:4-hydroxybenzoate polyprenyltransferase/phosphoserine phosphatase
MATELKPLCVDLDGTLIRTDSLWETVLQIIKIKPITLLSLLSAYFRAGRSGFKSKAIDLQLIDPASLPYHSDIIDYIKKARGEGQQILLVTGANQRLADCISAHIGLFDGVIGSHPGSNNTGDDKAAELVSRFGERGFDYAGNSRTDLKVWKHSHAAVVVGSEKLADAARELCPVLARFDAGRMKTRKALVKAIRPHQWFKNVILFLPILASHRLFEIAVIGHAILAFLAFSLCASGLYVMNDLLDLTSDRKHPSKHKRPFAAGNLPLSWGVAMCPALLLISLVISLLLPTRFLLVMVIYVILTTSYSFHFKKRVLVDVFFLASLYTIRLIAGHEATQIKYSHWLTGFSIFFFLSLALVKRGSELVQLRDSGKLHTEGRGYLVSDVPTICNFGMVAGGLSVLYLAMYINSGEVNRLYSNPDLLLALCPLVFYWIGRLWLLVDRGQMHHDPVVFALKDRISYYILCLCAMVVAVAKLWN